MVIRTISLSLLVGMLAPVVLAAPPAPPPAPPPRVLVPDFSPVPDGPSYVISAFELAYVKQLPFLPDRESLRELVGKVEIELAVVDGAFVAPRGDLERVTITPDAVSTEGPMVFHWSALVVVCRAVAETLMTQEALQMFVAPAVEDVDPETMEDLRGGRRTTMGIELSYDGPFFPVGRCTLRYAVDDPGQPPIEEIVSAVEVPLVRIDEGWVTWRPGIAPTPVPIARFGAEGPEPVSAGAIQALMEAVRDRLTRTIMGVRVQLEDGQLEADDIEGLVDVRRKGVTDLRFLIVTGQVRELRTLALGDRIPPEDRVNNTAHAWIRERSPIQPPVEGEPAHDLVLRDELNEYLSFLSRHPGRRVDAALAPARDEFGVALDYLVSENKPLLLYGQVSNTGTEQTNKIRYRAGLFDNQLTGHDDILSIEGISDFDKTDAVIGSYEAKWGDMERLRWRLYAAWNEFTASDVGFANENFTGSSWTVGGEAIWNFKQKQDAFFDFIGGVRYFDTKVNNAFVFVEGRDDFIIPYVGARMQRYTETANTELSTTLEFQFGDVTGVDAVELNALGRLFPDKNWVILGWDAFHSFYLEPLLSPKAWKDPTTPGSTLAHEVALHFWGQYAFNYRLIPQVEAVAGGLYTVRGYKESVAVGDTVILTSAEYRFHLPRALTPKEDPGKLFGQPFRWRPQHAYGRADWDLILRAFVDAGWTINSDRQSFESNETLVGTGIGAQLLIGRNLDLRVDWGFALDGIEGEVDAGSNQVYFVATIFF